MEQRGSLEEDELDAFLKTAAADAAAGTTAAGAGDPATVTTAVEAAAQSKLNEKFLEAFVSTAVRAATERAETRRSLLDFGHLLVSIAARIGLAISIQLLAASVRAQQPSRLVRTISLTSLAAFFVFVEALATRQASPSVLSSFSLCLRFFAEPLLRFCEFLKKKIIKKKNLIQKISTWFRKISDFPGT